MSNLRKTLLSIFLFSITILLGSTFAFSASLAQPPNITASIQLLPTQTAGYGQLTATAIIAEATQQQQMLETVIFSPPNTHVPTYTPLEEQQRQTEIIEKIETFFGFSSPSFQDAAQLNEGCA